MNISVSISDLSPSERSQNRTGEVIGASVPLLVLPTLAVALRLLSRRISKAPFWWDDYTIVLACFFCWGPNIVELVFLNYGFGRHLGALLEQTPYASLKTWFILLYAFEFNYALAMTSVKFSIILFLYRIFPIVQFRRILLWCNHFVVCLTIACILVSIFQCVPIHNFWDTMAGRTHHELGGTCINVQLYFLIASSIAAFTDFVLLALPIPLVWRLKTSRPQKLVLTGIFTVGLTVCAVSVTRLAIISEYSKRQDFTWYYVPIVIWTTAEPSIAVVSACLPSLRPLFVRVFWRSTPRPQPACYHSNSAFNRLQEVDQRASKSWPWSGSKHNVKVYGGQRPEDGESDDVELGDQAHFETPKNRIRAKTTVVLTISDRVDFQDDLF